MAAYRPAHLLLQWHLSDVCNLRCTHCYQDSYRHERYGLAAWQGLLGDYRAFLHNAGGAGRVRGHINVTGGEPFALRDFPALLEQLARHRDAFGVGILSNGTLVDRDRARWLQTLGVGFVQVSIDGVPATHDRIRGAGSHARAVAGIEALVAAQVRVVISFTAQRDTFREFPQVAQLGHALGVSRVWSDREIPAHVAPASAMLSAAETDEYLALMAQARAALPPRSRTEVALHRALQFLEGGDAVYRCTAGDTLIAVMPDGTVYPCRRLPIAVGNVYTQPLAAVYDSAAMRQIRAPQEYAACAGCGFVGQCQGGLRCLSWAVHGRLDRADPGCSLAQPSPTARAVIPLVVSPPRAGSVAAAAAPAAAS